MTFEYNDTATKQYEIRQLTDEGSVLTTGTVEAISGEAAAKQLQEEHLHNATGKIEVCLDGEAVNEMGVSYWRKRLRRR